MRRGFTLVELLVVVAMIVILAGALTTSIAKSQQRARIARAETEVREMTNAILAFANYSADGTLASKVRTAQPSSEGSLDFILGKVTERGQEVPVLFNATIRGTMIVDPWGHPYKVTIKKGERIRPPGVPNLEIGLFCPNWHRLREGER